jgi:hypothetical protein
MVISGSYVGTVISLPLSAALAESSAGWPAIFYVFGKYHVFQYSVQKIKNKGENGWYALPKWWSFIFYVYIIITVITCT